MTLRPPPALLLRYVVTMLASGDFHMLAATKPSPLVPHALCLAWGYGAEGQGGHGGSLHLRTPRPVDALRGARVAQIGCGSWWSAARTEDGALYAWG